METNIGISDNDRQDIATELFKMLADEFVLYTKTLNAYWNAEGADFYNKHQFFQGQYMQSYKFIDSVATRIRSLGHYVPATLASLLNLTQLTEITREKNDSHGFIKELLGDHESIIIQLRENIHRIANDFQDEATSSLLASLLREHEEMAWFLRAHL